MEFVEFKYRMWSLLHSTRASLFKIVEPIIQKEGLTTLQLFLLYSIKQNCTANVSSICRVLVINQGNASTMCKRLEKQGYIRRCRNSEDERVVSLSLTEQGHAVIDRFDEGFSSHQEKFGSIPSEKFDIIIRGFEELDALIKQL
ncbi:MAG: MarR family winged helix-turn-helix transcriptional regulator [Eubacteriales bacterium]